MIIILSIFHKNLIIQHINGFINLLNYTMANQLDVPERQCNLRQCKNIRTGDSVYCDEHDTWICAANNCKQRRLRYSVHCRCCINVFLRMYNQYKHIGIIIKPYINKFTLFDELPSEEILKIRTLVNESIVLRIKHQNEGFKKHLRCGGHDKWISHLTKVIEYIDSKCNGYNIISNHDYWAKRMAMDYPLVQYTSTAPEILYMFIQNKNIFSLPFIFNKLDVIEILSALSVFGDDAWLTIQIFFMRLPVCPDLLILPQILNYPVIGQYILNKCNLNESYLKRQLHKLSEKTLFSDKPDIMAMWATNDDLYLPFVLVKIGDANLIKRFVETDPMNINLIAEECIYADNLDCWMILTGLSNETNLDDVIYQSSSNYYRVGNRDCLSDVILLYVLIQRPRMLNYFVDKFGADLASSGCIHSNIHSNIRCGNLLWRSIFLKFYDSAAIIIKHGFYDCQYSTVDDFLEGSAIQAAIDRQDVKLYQKLIGAVLNPCYDKFSHLLTNDSVSTGIVNVTRRFLASFKKIDN